VHYFHRLYGNCRPGLYRRRRRRDRILSKHAVTPEQCAGGIVKADKKGTLAAAMQAIADQNG